MSANIKTQIQLFRIGVICALLIYGTTSLLYAQGRQVQPVTHGHASFTESKQTKPFRINNPPSRVAAKINLLYAATLTPNLALEIGLGKQTTLELGGGYNFFEPGNGKRWKHWLVQPEFRYWFCERFNGSFLGIHALGGEYNFARIDLPLSVFSDLKDFRYEGHYYGAGIVYGYQWILHKRWNLEASVGLGYVRVHYDKYNCEKCGTSIKNGTKNYWGPTKVALSFIYFL